MFLLKRYILHSAGVHQSLYASKPAVTTRRFGGVSFNCGTFMDSVLYLAHPRWCILFD